MRWSRVRSSESRGNKLQLNEIGWERDKIVQKQQLKHMLTALMARNCIEHHNSRIFLIETNLRIIETTVWLFELVTSHSMQRKRNEGSFQSTCENLFIAIIVHSVTRHTQIISAHVGTDSIQPTNEPYDRDNSDT